MKLFRLTVVKKKFFWFLPTTTAQAVLLATDKAGAMIKITKYLNDEFDINIDKVNIKIEEFDVSEIIWSD